MLEPSAQHNGALTRPSRQLSFAQSEKELSRVLNARSQTAAGREGWTFQPAVSVEALPCLEKERALTVYAAEASTTRGSGEEIVTLTRAQFDNACQKAAQNGIAAALSAAKRDIKKLQTTASRAYAEGKEDSIKELVTEIESLTTQKKKLETEIVSLTMKKKEVETVIESFNVQKD